MIIRLRFVSVSLSTLCKQLQKQQPLANSVRAFHKASNQSLYLSRNAPQCSTRLLTAQKCMFHTTPIHCEDRIVQSPPFAESVSEGDIRWQKAVGDSVVEDEVVGEIETDKTSMPVHAPYAGVIAELLVADGDKVIAKQNLFKLTVGAGGAPPKKSETPAPSKQEVKKPEPAKPAPASAASAAPKATDANWETKKVEAPKNVKDLQLSGQSDSFASTTLRSEHKVKMNRMRKRISQRLKDAQNTAAMLTTFNEIDMTNIFDLRERYKDAFLKRHGAKLGFMSAFCKGSAMALQAMPEVNAVIDNEDILYRNYVDISIAVSTTKGLVVPVLRNVEQMNFSQIELGINELGERARNNTLAVEDMDGGTFTISNGGVFGSLFGTPIINPPQSAILGLHGIFQRPVVVSGSGATAKIEARPMMYVALTYDHRLIDGREAVTFLRKVKAFIEDPRVLFLDL